MVDIIDRAPPPTPQWTNGEMPSALARVKSGMAQADNEAKNFDASGMTFEVNEDGSVDFVHPAPAIRRQRNDDAFGENLVDSLPESSMQAIATDYLDGVASDILSRSQFIANYNRGIDLMGLKIEEPSSSRGSRQSISKIKHPALLEACAASTATAQGQLLPAGGPVKVATVGAAGDADDLLARDFESDFNYYLTDIEKGYYPDTKRGLFLRAYGGTMFKKVYLDPVRKMPVSRVVGLTDLIISEDATDLESALRKTNEILMTSQQVRRMQLLGDLGPAQINTSPARRKILDVQGLAQAQTRQQDVEHTIYEGYGCFDPLDYGLDEHAPDGLPLPYKVVIDKDSQQVLAVHRNWRKGDDEFRERQVFVKYGFVPGFGFLDLGFLHLIGNQTRALTAIWQILVDKGMLANFPGGLKAKSIRMSTNEINGGVGEWPDVDLGPYDDIRKAFMAMPYGDISQVFMAFAQAIENDVQRLAGTTEIEIGEGRANVPVGTIMAMLEQQTQQMSAVHKSDHTSQKEELRLLRDLFVENPKSLTKLARDPKRRWEVGQEFADLNIVPASDPNVPSQMHRIMQSQFIADMAGKFPMLFTNKEVKVGVRVLTSIGIADPESLMASQAQVTQAMQSQGKPAKAAPGAAAAAKAQAEAPYKQGELQLEGQRLHIEQQQNQREAAESAASAQLDQAKLELEQNKLASEHTIGMAQVAGDSAADPNAQADLDLTKAKTFSAMGSGAAGFAKANDTVQQGVRDQEAYETGAPQPGDPSVTPPAAPGAAPATSSAPRLQRPKGKRNNPPPEGTP